MVENISKSTTIKLSRDTKERLDHLKVYSRESYEEIVMRMLEILNICRVNPQRARYHLVMIDKQRKDISSLRPTDDYSNKKNTS